MPEFLTPLLIALAIFALLGVILEEVTHVNKAKVTLFFGTIAWVLLYIFSESPAATAEVTTNFSENLGEIANLWLFLVATMTFVAYLNKKGMIENLIYLFMPKEVSEKALLFLTAIFCFVFSSLADNITATLVSMTLVLSLKLEAKKTVRFATLVVFAVNSGGVALITGDVTTLMIFLAGKIGIADLLSLIAPAFIAVMALAFMLSFGLNGRVIIEQTRHDVRRVDMIIAAIFLLTIFGTIIGNALFQLPPALTFLFGLSVMFLVSRFYNDDEDQILEFIRTIEFETLLFFLGILLLVGMLKEIAVLEMIAHQYGEAPAWIANYVIGFVSALVDNVPLTAALLKSDIDMDATAWMALTYSVGAGGSLLVIGSAAGIVAMSKVKDLTFKSHLSYIWLLIPAYTLGYFLVYVLGGWLHA
ncbi:sodium:proton antiporter NhaD [Saccharospirillum mangrovi]|uniref:sodium:proton antiporter NhaD n=1 Tax=Saccharospirillum mangrovi TaxID=2161747 RepID=UPI000D3A9ECE|nr:sodium:proton antiporter NhaD [Saccharospirillum mangrovi]